MKTFSCKNCPDRTPGCHDRCEKYQREKTEYERLKSLANADREINAYTYRNRGKRMDIAAKKRKSRPRRDTRQW